MDYSLDLKDYTVESSVTPYHPTEIGWYVKHASGLYLSISKEGIVELSEKPHYHMTKELATSFLNHVINKTLIIIL